MRKDRDLLKPNYQGDGKMYGSEIAMSSVDIGKPVVDEKLELAKAIARF